MVRGLNIFKKYFEQYPENYVIIGGTACDIILDEAGFVPRQMEDGLHHANIEALICLKAKAFLEIKERIEKGSQEDTKQLKKHKTDVFRLTVMLTPESEFDIPGTIQVHVNQFAVLAAKELPDKGIFKEMGLRNIDPGIVFEQFKKSFKVNVDDAEFWVSGKLNGTSERNC